MSSLQINPPASSVQIALPSVALSETRPGMDSAGAAMAAALIQETKVNMDSQYAQFNFLNALA
jgi:hypothetical protein